MLPYLRFKRASILEHAEQMRKMIQKVGDEIYTENNSDINTYWLNVYKTSDIITEKYLDPNSKFCVNQTASVHITSFKGHWLFSI
jgi:hypothetical protein